MFNIQRNVKMESCTSEVFKHVHELFDNNIEMDDCSYCTQTGHVVDGENAIKQLMSDFKIPKQKKVILFSGENTQCSRTIYQIQDSSQQGDAMKDIYKVAKVGKKEIIHKCQYCNELFGNLKTLRAHCAVHKQIYQNNLKCCDVCGRTFKSEEKFGKHIAGHNDPDLECPKCFKVLQTKYTLRKHIQLMHSRKLACPNCTLSYDDEKKLDRHIQRFHSKKFACSYCEQSFKSLEALQTHKIVHRVNRCKICKAVFYTEEGYLKHLEDHGLDEFISVEDIPENFDIMNTTLSDINVNLLDDSSEIDPYIQKIINDDSFSMNPQRKSRVCIVCNKNFNRRSDIKRHLIEHIIKRSLGKTQISEDGNFSILCDICRVATFCRVDLYKAHLREHAKLTIYKCLLCNKTFSDSSNFSKHKKYHGQSRYECNFCKKTFNSKINVYKHLHWHV